MFYDFMFNAKPVPRPANFLNAPTSVLKCEVNEKVDNKCEVSEKADNFTSELIARVHTDKVSASHLLSGSTIPFIVNNLSVQSIKDISSLIAAYPAAVISNKRLLERATFKTEPSYDGPYRQAVRKRLSKQDLDKRRKKIRRRCCCPTCCHVAEVDRRNSIKLAMIEKRRAKKLLKQQAQRDSRAYQRTTAMLQHSGCDEVEARFKWALMEGNAYSFPSSWFEYAARLRAYRRVSDMETRLKRQTLQADFLASLELVDEIIAPIEPEINLGDYNVFTKPAHPQRRAGRNSRRSDEAQARTTECLSGPIEGPSSLQREMLKKIRTAVKLFRATQSSSDIILTSLAGQDLIAELQSDYEKLADKYGTKAVYNKSALGRVIEDHLNYINYE